MSDVGGGDRHPLRSVRYNTIGMVIRGKQRDGGERRLALHQRWIAIQFLNANISINSQVSSIFRNGVETSTLERIHQSSRHDRIIKIYNFR